MSPWNYPFMLSLDPLVDAIAAGNTVVLKPSAYSPATGAVVKKIIEEHGGKIWATSKEGTGTIMYFVIRKYQEVPIHE